MAAYDDPAGIIAGSVVMWILALASVTLRFYSVKWRHQRFTASEWLILAAFVFGTGLTVMEIYGITHMRTLFRFDQEANQVKVWRSQL